MSPAQDSPRAQVGDLVIVEGHRIGEARRIGEILEVLGEARREHYRVRWDDDHESVFYPSSDSTIQKAEPRKKRKSSGGRR
jgi:rRNA processing protein Gar1